MQVTKNITLDLLETGSPVIIKAKQNDRNTRYIAAHLYVGRLDYQVPSGTEIAFRYKKPDGTAGFYDALPDNSPAITVSGNTVTVELVEQVLTAAGCVHCEINMYNAASEKLTTFTFEISVEESVLTDAEIISSDYYNVLTAEIAKALQAVTDATEQAENAAQSAQEAADSASMSKDWAAGQPVTYNGAPVSIAYAGAQRIASITAYGENAQGGTTEAPVALTGVDSVFVSGNNLLPKAVRTETTGGITFTPNPDGSILVSGTATTNVGYSYAHFERALLGRTVCLSGGSTQAQVLINERLSSGAFVRNVLVDRGQGVSGILTKQKEDNILYATIQVLAGTTVNTTIYPMLNLGESPLPYEPYQGRVTPLPIPRPLHEVGDVRDVCRTRVKSVYDKRIVLDGTENWTIYSTKPNSFRTAVPEIILSGLSDSYPTLKSSEVGTKNGVYLSYTDAVIVTDLACSTVEEFKAHLSAHPLTVYYRTAAYDGTNGLDVCQTEYLTGFVELDGTEKNLIDWESILTQFSTHAEVTKSISGNTITLSGTPTAVFRQIQVSNILISPSIRGKSATLSANISGNQPSLVLRQFNESNVKITETNMAGTGAVQITISQDTAYLQIILCLNRQTTGTAFMASYGDVQLELGDVTFHDYGNGKGLFLDLSRSAFGQYSLEFSHGEVGGMPTITGGLAASFNASNLYRLQIIGIPDTWTALGVTDVATAKTWLAAQKAAGTPVQVVYQLATPEVYATDPVDFDNAAGPLNVMTGGELEVRMTELIGSRSPELTAKMDKDIYFQVGNLNLGDNTNLLNPVNQQGQASYTGDSTSPYCIDRWRISNGTTYNIVSRTLTASSYANRACGMWQTNELAQQALAIGSTITFSGYINGMQHFGTMKIHNRDLYSSFAEVPAGYECDDFEIVCCTASHEQSKYNLGIYPKKEAVLNWIKWEKGLYATPYAPKGFGLEQLECMRYFQTIKGIKYVLRKALASDGFPYVIPVTFMPMRAVPQTDITVTEGAENNLTATGVTQTACGIQFQPVAENVGLTFTLTLSANL